MAQRRTMSQHHKEAIRRARRENKAVRQYLELQRNRSRRGPRRTKERVAALLVDVEAALEAKPSAIEELQMVQRRRDLHDELASMADDDHAAVEDAFVAVAKGFAERNGIQYESWRDVGVEAAVLKRAGITRRPSAAS